MDLTAQDFLHVRQTFEQNASHALESTLQMVNYNNTIRNSKPTMPALRTQNKTETTHSRALQILSNNEEVSYKDTLRIVGVEGDRQPLLPPRVTRKHPGCIRNESGGLFTS